MPKLIAVKCPRGIAYVDPQSVVGLYADPSNRDQCKLYLQGVDPIVVAGNPVQVLIQLGIEYDITHVSASD